MKVLWCWRCQIDVPMLDEEEYERVSRLYSECMRATKEFRQQWALPLEGLSMEMRFKPVLVEYERLTGFAETVANAVMHHRLSLHGPACASCGKPLRTPQARHCAACGTPRK